MVSAENKGGNKFMKKLVFVVIAIAALSVGIPKPVHAQEYQVRPGDTIWKVAYDFEKSVTEIKELNHLDSDEIFPGQVLRLEEEEIIHTIEKGDTLFALANKYNVTVVDLINWNELDSDLIIIGHTLVIYPNAEAVTTDDEVTVPVQSNKQSSTQSTSHNNSSNKTMKMTATAYTAECDGCSGITYTGLNLLENRNMKVIAVDPNVIPLGTRVHVEGYGEAIAGDIGGAIKGNKIDIHVPTKDEAYSWGVREVTVTILE